MSHIYDFPYDVILTILELERISPGPGGYLPIYNSGAALVASNLWGGLQTNNTVLLDFDHSLNPITHIIYYDKQLQSMTMKTNRTIALLACTSDSVASSVNISAGNDVYVSSTIGNIYSQGLNSALTSSNGNSIIMDEDSITMQIVEGNNLYLNAPNISSGVLKTDVDGIVTSRPPLGFGVFYAGAYRTVLDGPFYQTSGGTASGNNGRWFRLGINATTTPFESPGPNNVTVVLNQIPDPVLNFARGMTFNGNDSFTLVNAGRWRISYYGMGRVAGPGGYDDKLYNINLAISVNTFSPPTAASLQCLPGQWASTNIVIKNPEGQLIRYQTPINGEFTFDATANSIVAIWASYMDSSNTIDEINFDITYLNVIFEQLY